MFRATFAPKLRPSLPAPAPGIAAVSLLVVACLGCASFRPVDPKLGPVALSGNEGLLVLHFDTEVALATVGISGVTAVENIPVGIRTRIVAAPAGSYRWDRITPLARGRNYHWRLSSFEDTWGFTVEAGKINYPGLFVVREGPDGVYAPRLGVYMTNRSGMMLRRLERAYPSLLEKLPMIYTGRGRDEYLERFRAAQVSQRAAAANAAGSH